MKKNRVPPCAVWLAMAGGTLIHPAEAANVTVDAGQVVRTVDSRMFGLNTAVWDGALQTADTIPLLKGIDIRILRFPGGSTSDTYDWHTNRSYQTGTHNLNNWTWSNDFDAFAEVARSTGAQAFITVNYGSGSAQDAADWVEYSNVTKGYGFKYWEIGNECYGPWEEDIHSSKQDPVVYADQAADSIALMRAVDPTIKIGVVVIDGEDTYAQNRFTAVTNPRTNQTHKGWTPLVLNELKQRGVTPDFAIYHRYPWGPGGENDANLLGGSSLGGTTWANDAAGLRQQLTDYLGADEAAKVELVATESNDVYTSPGKQSTSLVNALYLADSVGRLLQTEFNSYVWWCLRNGPQDTGQNNSAALYGWRNYGDYGVVAPGNATQTAVSAPYPTYFAMRLLSHFARGGDEVVQAGSDNSLLATYAVKRADGTLALLIVNKSPIATTAADITIGGFTPAADATVYSYGIPQDNEVRDGTGAGDIAVSAITNAGPSFSASFAPYSATVIALASGAAGAPSITTQPQNQTATAGGSVTLTAAASGTPAPAFQWRRNGAESDGQTSAVLSLPEVEPAGTGLYTVTAASTAGQVTSAAAIVGLTTTGHAIGTGTVLATDVPHPNGNHYDQVLLNGTAASISTQGGRVTRTSFIDDDGDIVQVEFAGPGTLSLLMDNASAPAAPVKYNQGDVGYVSGHVGIVIAGATEQTNVLVFTVGRSTAFDLTNHYNILLPPSETNVPANNGSPLFSGHAMTVYDGVADIAFIAIVSANGKFGGVRTADTRYSARAGLTGIYAPGVQFNGPIYLGEVSARGDATPVIRIGSTVAATAITGGSLFQANGRAVQVSGLTQLKFQAGSDSGGNLHPAQQNQARLEQDGEDVTSQIVVNP
ncbi:MAG TPA: immunoglobulin domain-containing protein [Opitutus sp.]|nr:immunoglobulin domain-containing protein [Opitutus sp.]